MTKSENSREVSSVEGGQLLKITSPANWIALVGILVLIIAGIFWSIFGQMPVEVSGHAVLLPEGGVSSVRTTQAGVISRLTVAEGERVNDAEIVAELFSLGGSSEKKPVLCHYDGFVLQSLVETGAFVQEGDSLFTIGLGDETRLNAWLFIPFEDVVAVKEGMDVHLSPVSVSSEQAGYIKGVVSKVERFPANQQKINNVFGNDPRWVNYLLGEDDPKALVYVTLDSGSAGNDYSWTMNSGAAPSLEHGMMCSGQIRVSFTDPISSVLPGSKGH